MLRVLRELVGREKFLRDFVMVRGRLVGYLLMILTAVL